MRLDQGFGTLARFGLFVGEMNVSFGSIDAGLREPRDGQIGLSRRGD